jgi:tetratricopeptide (TPR) repeat protein
MFIAFLASSILSLSFFLPEPGFALQGRNTIEGRVTTSENRPLENVRVFLQGDYYSQLGQTYTDGSGRYQFRGIRRGNYYVQVEPSGTGYERQTQRVEVNAPDLAGTGGADFYRADFVLKPDRAGKREGEDAARSINTAVFYQNVPDPAKEAFKQGARNLEKNELREAEVALVHAIKLFPDYYDALELLGSMYVKYAQYDAGLPLLGHAVEVNQRGWQAFYSLGVALLESKRRAEGLDALRRARTLNQESINVNMRLGLELAKEETSYEEAITALTKVTELAGKRLPDAYLALAALYGKRKQYNQEANALEGFLRAAPDTPQRENIKRKIVEVRQKAKSEANK